MISWSDFENPNRERSQVGSSRLRSPAEAGLAIGPSRGSDLGVEMRVGTIIKAEDFPEAKNPSYKLKIDFGSYGIKNSSAQITKLYKKEDLVGKQIIAVVNFPPKQIANFVSECLVLGVVSEGKEVILLQPERKVENGLKIA